MVMSGEFEQAVPAGKEIGRKIEAFSYASVIVFCAVFSTTKTAVEED